MLKNMSKYLKKNADNNRNGEKEMACTVKTLVVFNDVHIPFHHVRACNNVQEFCKDIQPDNIAINGDFMDCYSLSIFPKAKGAPDMQDELDIGKAFLTRLRKNCPKAVIDYLEGNHEERLKRIVKERAAALDLRALTIPALLGLDELNIKYHSYKRPVNYGPLSVVHGHRVSKHSAYTAKAHLLDDGYQNVIIGHTHRMGAYYYTGHTGKRRAYENGGLYDSEQLEYVVEPNWQNGFCIVYLDSSDPNFVQIVPIEMDKDGAFFWQGKHYGKGE